MAHQLLVVMFEVIDLRIAVPVWEGRVSPLLDVAERLLVVDVDAGQEVSRSLEGVGPGVLPQLVAMVKAAIGDRKSE